MKGGLHMGRKARKSGRKKTRKVTLTMKQFHEINKSTGTVKKSLKADPEYRKWYKQNYPNSRYAK